MSESHYAKRSNQDVQERFEEFPSFSVPEGVYGQAGKNEEKYEVQ